MTKFKKSVKKVLGRLSLIKVIFLLVALVAFFSAVAMTVTSQTGFCNSCHIMNDYYASWQRSSHHEVSCLSCHLQPGFTGYIKGKINGLAQAVDCMVGRVGTKAEATVLDQSCLRSACHSTRELLNEEQILFDGVKFKHQGHIQTTIDGINVTCATCHNHTHGDEHFSVNKEVCFTCHFTRSPNAEAGLVKNECLNCHNIPEGIIDRGLVTINHRDFVSYDASCEDSCHKRQIEHVSDVSDNSCLHCHTYGISPDDTSEELHAVHTADEKVECLACHGQVLHGPDKTSAVATMMSCENCHSNTHGAQKTIFSAEQAIAHGQDEEKVLSPMFLTHVECTGCHIESTSSKTAALDSLGTVARAVPEACDHCHEPGTGQRYIPFWQKNIKSLYGQVLEHADSLERSLAARGNDAAGGRIREARSILESVRADGSWGVHNLKYTEAILLEAQSILKEIESGQNE